MLQRLIKLGDATSQLINTLFGGHPNESISGRAYREKRPWERWINTLLWFDKDHCRVSYENDVKWAGKLLAEHRTRRKLFNSVQ